MTSLQKAPVGKPHLIKWINVQDRNTSDYLEAHGVVDGAIVTVLMTSFDSVLVKIDNSMRMLIGKEIAERISVGAFDTAGSAAMVL